ncbi:hypothetical protein [Actinoplanes utahensis]|uniref:Intracellular proteinase inhibitor BsuPI domain-containing protein n=1 Tax=Actinoplanes utahensis TaxID=1869 RepID=A0A0A6UCM5_ACTUT|nr:hypothetical protein [Actinoplanes utahensis]KHD72803.1 hypothetical protein MB27_38930 [Actinoplanes utahensis]
MRATVGPLPPAVYWRRRAVVLGAVLLGVIVLFMSCNPGDEPDPKKTSAEQPALPPTGAQDPSASASATPSFEESPPAGGNPFPDPQQTSPAETLPPPANTGAPVVGAGEACADGEITVTPVPATQSPQRGTPLRIQLKIKNSSARACTRDLGASAQELYIEQGATKFWSSDQCNSVKGNQVETLAAGAERIYEVTWNGRQSTACTDNVASGPVPAAGAYTLRGRLDGRVSEAVGLTIVG